jgi:hypothetical protein
MNVVLYSWRNPFKKNANRHQSVAGSAGTLHELQKRTSIRVEFVLENDTRTKGETSSS